MGEGRVPPWMSCQVITGPYVRFCGLIALLQGTLAVLWKNFGTFLYYQNTLHVSVTPALEPETLRFAALIPNRLSYHHHTSMIMNKNVHFYCSTVYIREDKGHRNDHLWDFQKNLSKNHSRSCNWAIQTCAINQTVQNCFCHFKNWELIAKAAQSPPNTCYWSHVQSGLLCEQTMFQAEGYFTQMNRRQLTSGEAQPDFAVLVTHVALLPSVPED